MSDLVLCFISKTVGPWQIQVHSRHGSKEHDQKHIHITRPGLGGEYSWNKDGSRHDKHRFPKSEPMIKAAKSIAASELGISVGSLQFITSVPGGLYVNISHVNNTTGRARTLLDSYIRVSETCHIFEGDRGLIVVMSDEV
jgi:hypothetical protein